MLQRDIFIIVDVNKGKKCENVLNFFLRLEERERELLRKRLREWKL